MTLRTIGALPGVKLHPGLAAVINPLKARERAQNAANVDISIDVDPGFLEQAAASFTAMLDPEIGLGAELDALEAQVDAVAALKDDARFIARASARLAGSLGRLTAGLDVSNIHAWKYDGGGGRFAPLFAQDIGSGIGDISPDEEVRAAIFAASSPANWATFSAAIFTGWGGGEVATKDTKGLITGVLEYLGGIPGGMLLAQASLAAPEVTLEIAAMADAIVQLGIDIAALLLAQIGVGVSFGAAAALAASASLLFPIPSLDVKIAVELTAAPIVAALEATLNGAGIHLWSFDGKLRDLGPEFQKSTRNGIAGGGPGDRAMGLILLTDNVQAWDDINGVLKVY